MHQKKAGKSHRALKITGLSFLSVILVVVLVAGGFVLSKLNKIQYHKGEEYSAPVEETLPGGETVDAIPDAEERLEQMDKVMDIRGLNHAVRQWATNDVEKMSGSDVINVLLMGIDASNARSDSIILLSLNKSAKTIHMTSILRDNYAYFGDASGDHFNKLNEMYGYGGPNALIHTIETLYKIEIDNFVSVNLNTFPKVIDVFGGVDLKITAAEARYLGLGSTADTYHMQGAAALRFSQIRTLDKNDSDINRAERQRRVLTALLDKAKGASAGELNETLDLVLPNLTTDFSRGNLLSFGTQAIVGGWVKYPVTQLVMPQAGEYWGGLVNQLWYWITDYPTCAQELQQAVYGRTNITIEPGHVNFASYIR